LRIADRELKIDEIVGAAERELCLFDRGARSVCQTRARAVVQQWCAFPSPNRPGVSCFPVTPGVVHARSGSSRSLRSLRNPENPGRNRTMCVHRAICFTCVSLSADGPSDAAGKSKRSAPGLGVQALPLHIKPGQPCLCPVACVWPARYGLGCAWGKKNQTLSRRLVCSPTRYGLPAPLDSPNRVADR